LTTEAEAQTGNREAEDPTMTEEASFQIPSHTATDLPTEEREAEAVADMTTTIDAQWEVKETDSKEDLTVDQMATHMAALGRESTTVTASTAIKRVTSLSTVALLEEREEEAAIMGDIVEVMVDMVEVMVYTAAVAVVAAIGKIHIEKIEEDQIEEDLIEEDLIEEIKTEENKIEDKTTLTVSESVLKVTFFQHHIAINSIAIPHLRYKSQ